MNDIKSSITETHERWHKGHIEPFWSKQSFSRLDYQRKTFNNEKDFIRWKRQGYWQDKRHYGGLLCDMTQKQTIWNNDIIAWFEDTYKAKDVGTSYFKMETCSYLPNHSDTYDMYRKLFNCKLKDCFRVIVFLEDWRSGHISEIDSVPLTNWRAGDYVFWESDTSHMAGNMGVDHRYTLQITGHR
jgi:hypothetical protein